MDIEQAYEAEKLSGLQVRVITALMKAGIAFTVAAISTAHGILLAKALETVLVKKRERQSMDGESSIEKTIRVRSPFARRRSLVLHS